MLRYGITPEDYGRLHKAQDGRCAICREKEKTRRRLSVDHNHTTNIVRGLLCAFCNVLLGLAKDDPKLLGRAIGYLNKEREGGE